MSADHEKIALIPAARVGKCPECGAEISWQHWAEGGFYCPKCRVGLRLRPAYFRALYCVALLMVALGVWALGFRGSGHLSLVLLGILPTYWLVVYLTLRAFPVDLQTTGDVRGLLYGVADVDTVQPRGDVAVPAVGANEIAERPVALRESPFRQIEAPATVDGVLLKVGALALALYAAWAALTAVLLRVRPDLVETRRAPRGSALRAELREDAMVFTNISGVDWTCEIALGSAPDSAFRTTFWLASQQTLEIPYTQLRPVSDTTESGVLRSVAREQLWAQCTDPSGRTHAGDLR